VSTGPELRTDDERHGRTYARHRRSDPRIAARVHAGLGEARTVVAAALGGRTRIEAIPTPGDCLDGFVEAFWRRPEALLDPEVRSAQSGWTLLPPGAEERIVARLAADLASGAWDAEHGHLRGLAQLAGSVRLVVSAPA